MDTIEIGANHRRVVSITLAHLDELLCQITRWMRHGPTQSILYVERSRLSEKQREQIMAESEMIRQLLDEARKALGLEPVARDVGAAVAAACASLRESLQELQGRYLNRYGKPTDELTAYLDPMTERMIGHLDRIMQSAGVRRRSDRPGRKARD